MHLRAIEPTDLELLYTIENDPDMWDVGTTATPYSRHTLHQHIRAMGADITQSGELRLVIDISGTAIGLIDLTSYDPRSERAEVSIAILKEHRQKGYGQQALRLIEAHCRRHLHLHQLYALIPESNTPSCHTFEAAGYTQIATLPDWHFANGAYQNTLIYHLILQK